MWLSPALARAGDLVGGQGANRLVESLLPTAWAWSAHPHRPPAKARGHRPAQVPPRAQNQLCALAAARPVRGGVPVQQAVVACPGAVSEVVRGQESVPGQNTWVPFMFLQVLMFWPRCDPFSHNHPLHNPSTASGSASLVPS
jgi:hypothetical protein